MHVCVWYFGGTKPTKKNGKRDAFVHTIGFRPMVHEPAPSGARAAKGETERGRTGRPGELRTHGKTVCVCVGVRCVFRRAWTRGPFHAPEKLKPMDDMKSGDERHEDLCMTWHKGALCGNRLLGVTKRGNLTVPGCLTPV